MQALVVTEHGASDVLQVQTRELPSPSATQVQVRVAASGVNFIDVYHRMGVYPIPTPFVLGSEGAGHVSSVGSEVRDFRVGDAVAWVLEPGSHAEAVNIDATRAVHVPDGVSSEQAAAVLLQGMTAHYLLNSTHKVNPGDTVLVHAAAGGTGQLLVQLAKALGAKVIGSVGSAAKAATASALGADVVLRYDEIEDLASAVRAANSGHGVAVVYDGVGRSTFEASLASLAPRGLLALFGAASGQVPPFDLQRLNPAGSLFVTRPTLRDYIATREELLWRADVVLGAVADGSLRVEIDGRYRLADAASAYDRLEGRATTGKLVLTP